MDSNKWFRGNIRNLQPYASARSTFSGAASIFLDANENTQFSPAGEGFNRYPDTLQTELKQKIALIKGVAQQNIFIGNGSDEPIDLLMRACCRPGLDNMITFSPTYGMYQVAADINDVSVKTVALDKDFEHNAAQALAIVDDYTKIIFICTPNNPTGNLVPLATIEEILKGFAGIVVVDEAYIDFAGADKSCLPLLNNYENLVVLQTFSKAWGMAGLRLGTAFASGLIIEVLHKIKPPYNISAPVQQLALTALAEEEQAEKTINEIVLQREWLSAALSDLLIVEKVYPSAANFLLVKVQDADAIYNYLLKHGIVVRNRTTQPGCENCLRITVGSRSENSQLITTLQQY